MAFETYYDPKGSFVSNWNPNAKDTSTDEWLAQNMPWLWDVQKEDMTFRQKAWESGFRPSEIVPMPYGLRRLTQTAEQKVAANRGWSDSGDPYALQPVTIRDDGLKEYLIGPPMVAPELSKAEQEYADAYYDYQADLARDGALSGASIGAAGGPIGAVLGAGGGAVISTRNSSEGFAQQQIDLEEAERVARMEQDAARLQQEAAVSTARLTGQPVAEQDPLASSYAYEQPAGYDPWYQSLFA